MLTLTELASQVNNNVSVKRLTRYHIKPSYTKTNIYHTHGFLKQKSETIISQTNQPFNYIHEAAYLLIGDSVRYSTDPGRASQLNHTGHNLPGETEPDRALVMEQTDQPNQPRTLLTTLFGERKKLTPRNHIRPRQHTYLEIVVYVSVTKQLNTTHLIDPGGDYFIALSPSSSHSVEAGPHSVGRKKHAL